MQENAEDILRMEPAAFADLPAIRQLLSAAGLPTADVDEALLAGFLVLRVNRVIRGVAAVEALGPCGLLRSVAVAREFHSRGYGERLTRAAEALAASRKLSPLFLLTTTAADYFARRGYQRVDRASLPPEIRGSREFSSLCPESAIAMFRP